MIVTINPPIDTYYVTPGSNEATYSMTPLPATSWTPVNSAVSLVVAPQAINCATLPLLLQPDLGLLDGDRQR